MTRVIQLIRPLQLEEGEEYTRVEIKRNPPNRPVLHRVKFVTHDPSPAMVIVLDSSGKKIRCPRDEIFVSD
jgi:hypothetical protein